MHWLKICTSFVVFLCQLTRNIGRLRMWRWISGTNLSSLLYWVTFALRLLSSVHTTRQHYTGVLCTEFNTLKTGIVVASREQYKDYIDCSLEACRQFQQSFTEIYSLEYLQAMRRTLTDLPTTTTVLRLSGFCPELPRWAGYRKVKPIWICWSKR